MQQLGATLVAIGRALRNVTVGLARDRMGRWVLAAIVIWMLVTVGLFSNLLESISTTFTEAAVHAVDWLFPLMVLGIFGLIVWNFLKSIGKGKKGKK